VLYVSIATLAFLVVLAALLVWWMVVECPNSPNYLYLTKSSQDLSKKAHSSQLGDIERVPFEYRELLLYGITIHNEVVQIAKNKADKLSKTEFFGHKANIPRAAQAYFENLEAISSNEVSLPVTNFTSYEILTVNTRNQAR